MYLWCDAKMVVSVYSQMKLTPPPRVSIILKIFSLKNVGILWALSTGNSGWLAANHMLQVDERKCHRTRRGNLRRKNRCSAAPGGVKGRLETQRAQHFLVAGALRTFSSYLKRYTFHILLFSDKNREDCVPAPLSSASYFVTSISHGHQGLERTSVCCFHKSKMCSKILNALGALQLQTLRPMMHDNACLYMCRPQIYMPLHV